MFLAHIYQDILFLSKSSTQKDLNHIILYLLLHIAHIYLLNVTISNDLDLLYILVGGAVQRQYYWLRFQQECLEE